MERIPKAPRLSEAVYEIATLARSDQLRALSLAQLRRIAVTCGIKKSGSKLQVITRLIKLVVVKAAMDEAEATALLGRWLPASV